MGRDEAGTAERRDGIDRGDARARLSSSEQSTGGSKGS